MKDSGMFLKDVYEAIKSIEKFVEGMNFEEFKKDDKTSSAVVRKFEIIGEATKHISNKIRQKYPQIPWKEMAGMRDKLIHSYFEIDYKLVWTTIKERIPQVKSIINKIKMDIENHKKEN